MRSRELGAQVGQTAVEWLGLAAAVGVLALATAIGAGPAARSASDGLRRVVCVVGGGECPASVAVRAARPGLPDRAPARLEGARRFAASGPGATTTPPVSIRTARETFGYDDPARCASVGEAGQLCAGPDEALRTCRAVDDRVAFKRLASCSTRVDERDLGECGPAPNQRVDGAASGEVLCSFAATDGTTRVVRCDPGSIAQVEDGRATTIRACRDSAADLFAATDARRATCHAWAKDAVGLEVRGRPVWRFTSLCLSPGGGAYACYVDVGRRGGVDGLQPAHPVQQPDACDNRTIPAGLLGEGCRSTATFGVLRCTLADGTRVDCVRLEGTLQHCAAPPRETRAISCRPGGGRRLAGETTPAQKIVEAINWKGMLLSCADALPGSGVGVALDGHGQVLASTMYGETAAATSGPANPAVDELDLLAAVRSLEDHHEVLAAFGPGVTAGATPPLLVSTHLVDLPLQMTPEGFLLVGSDHLTTLGLDYAALRARQRAAVGQAPLEPRPPSVASTGGRGGSAAGVSGAMDGANSRTGPTEPVGPPATGPGSLDAWRTMVDASGKRGARRAKARSRGPADLMRRILPLRLGIRGQFGSPEAQTRAARLVDEIATRAEAAMAGLDLSTVTGVQAAGRLLEPLLLEHVDDLHEAGRGGNMRGLEPARVREAVASAVRTFTEDNLAGACAASTAAATTDEVLGPHPTDDDVLTQQELWLLCPGSGGSRRP